MPTTAPHKLVIVESPAKAHTISKYLGKGYKVIASQGHVRDLPKSQMGVDPDNDFAMKYITIRGRGDILEMIRKESKNASSILLATDPDREGEAISWHLANVLHIPDNAPCRIEFHEVTKKAVQNAIRAPRKLDIKRINAQQARRALDRLVGYKISPLLWVKVKKGLSAGRVQSVATRMVVTRERDIESFIPEEYWEITAECTVDRGMRAPFKAKLSAIDGGKVKIGNNSDSDKAVERIEKAKFVVTDVKTNERKKAPAPPFTTSSLQQEASRKLNFTTSRTMRVVQQLYEGVDIEGEGTLGLVTYIRTDSVRVSDDALKSVRELISNKYGKKYLPEKPVIYKGRKDAQDAHEAIRPTELSLDPESVKSSLKREQYQLYKLIYNRFVASQMQPAAYRTMTAEIGGDNVCLRFYGEQKEFSGFTCLYEEGSDDTTVSNETVLPKLAIGQKIKATGIEATQHFTQPPGRYTEASLVRAMEEIGIGRPSTYAPTISTIISRGYVSRENKRLYPTELGRMVTGMMEEYFPDVVDNEFTADMENRLDEVEDGNTEWKQLLREFYPQFVNALNVAEKEIEKIEVKDEVSDIPCEKCGAMLVYKMGRYGKFLACPNFPACRFTKPIVRYIGVKCPKCGGELVEKNSRKNRKFYGCEKYPDCDFVSWDKPVTDRCPRCGSYMIEKHTGKGVVYHICSNETCRYKTEINEDLEDKK